MTFGSGRGFFWKKFGEGWKEGPKVSVTGMKELGPLSPLVSEVGGDWRGLALRSVYGSNFSIVSLSS